MNHQVSQLDSHMMTPYLLIVITLVGIGCFNNSTYDLIIVFLREHGLKSSNFLVCWRNSDKVALQKRTYKSLLIRTSFLSAHEDGLILGTEPNQNRVGYVLDTSCPSYKNVLAEASKKDKFRFTYSWLIIHKNKSVSVGGIFDIVELRADMDMQVAISNSANDFDIFEVFKLGAEVNITINKIGAFLNGTLHRTQNKRSFYESRKDLTGVLLRSGSTCNYSLSTEEEFAEEYKNIQHQIFEKFDYVTFTNLKNTHHFGYNVTLQSVWYGNSSSGIDGGIAKLLHDKKLDISSAGGILRVGRMDFYDFLLPFLDFRTCYFFKNPGTVKPGTDVLKPFSLNAWYAVGVSGLLMSAAIKLAYYIEKRFFKSKIAHSFFTSSLITISILAQQGSAILPTHLGCRLIILNLLILSILLYNYYTSSLVSSLLSSKPTVMTTIKELYESNLKVGIEYQPYTITYIVQQKNDEYIQKLNSTKIYEAGKPNFLSPEEGISMVKKGGFAYHTNVETAYPLLARTFEHESICDLAEINFVTPGIVGLTLQKRSQYTELFQISLVKMRARGILKRDKDFWVPRKPECLLSSRVVSVGVNELFLVYLILFFGIIISLLILIIEIVYSSWTKNNMVSNQFIN